MSAPVGDQTLLQSYLINTRVYGYVIPATGQQQFTATYEIQGDQGTLTMAVVIGPEGPAGADMFALRLQTDAVDDPADLPQTLTNTSADIGKMWMFDDIDALGDIIGSSAYVWYGTSYRRMMFGQPGPPGPAPIITPSVDLIPYPGTSYVTIDEANPYFPNMDFHLSVPPGPEGPAPSLALCPDVDFDTNAPVPGDVLGFTGRYYTATLPPPTNLVDTVSSSGGSLAAGTYYWVVTTTTSLGESTVSNEVTATTGGSSSRVLLEWDAVSGAGGYKVYRGTSAGGENKLVGTVAAGTLSYLDSGGTGTTATPPGVNGAAINYPIWVPVAVTQLLPRPYSMPEAAFTAFSGISQRASIGSFSIPPQSFPWTPIVWGHIGAFGIELSANPLMIGCEVRLGDPTSGELIGRGFGNTLGEVNIMPHYSTPSTPGTAITPTNDTAVVPANHSNPAEGTVYVNLFNDGEIGLYLFQPTDAQLFIMLLPVTE